MLRSLINSGLLVGEPFLKLIQNQSVRRYPRKPRKPFWLGTAKSKRFIIRDEPILPPEERTELLRLYSNYKTSMKSIRHYLVSTDTSESASIDTTTFRASAEEIENSLKVNDEWNKECEKRRQERLTLNSLAHEKMAKDVIEIVNEKQAIMQERIEELVRIEKEKSKDFITRENLDKKIEECLGSETDYNYAIDLQGNMFTGYDTEMKASPLNLSHNERRIQMEENSKEA